MYFCYRGFLIISEGTRRLLQFNSKMRCRRGVEISAGIALILLAILFYQLYLQNIVILYVGNTNYTKALQDNELILQNKNAEQTQSQNTAQASPEKTQAAQADSPEKQPKPAEKMPVELPPKPDIEKLDFKAASSLYEKYVITKQESCKIIRLGNVQDGGWDLCSDSGYEPRNDGSCLVYSVGINNDFSFDDAISRKYGCTVHCFDPSLECFQLTPVNVL
ncbi:hypothetical protein KUTeg_002282 [Tegillarca granosa]|uniref:Methyltransferase domain-containing protein n=1 Tax=Tegillarca granosa TaxID=220873 RepID=A0ABQ9FWN0_TEGGR|nr:hypothetical protein KUTeg_002282 [Tegillarca granosa]